MKQAGRTLAILSAGVVLALTGCAPPPVSDDVVIATLKMDQQGFDQAVAWITAAPVLAHVDLREAGVSATPADVDPDRLEPLAAFMRRHGINSVGASPDGRTVSFQMSASGIGASGQLKELTYSRQRSADWTMVPDTDQEMAKPSDRWRVVYRDLGDGWYVENSCC